MATYLELVRNVRVMAGLGRAQDVGAIEGDLKTEQIAAFVADSYTELQNEKRWRWLRKKCRLAPTAGKDVYAPTDVLDNDNPESPEPISRFSEWVREQRNPWRVFSTDTTVPNRASGVMTWYDWDAFNYTYNGQSIVVGSQPAHMTIRPDDSLQIAPMPDDGTVAGFYMIGEYHRSAQVLEDAVDIPEMPEQYHRLIAYLALQKLAFIQSDDGLEQFGAREARKMKAALSQTQMNKVQKGAPLA